VNYKRVSHTYAKNMAGYSIFSVVIILLVGLSLLVQISLSPSLSQIKEYSNGFKRNFLQNRSELVIEHIIDDDSSVNKSILKPEMPIVLLDAEQGGVVSGLTVPPAEYNSSDTAQIMSKRSLLTGYSADKFNLIIIEVNNESMLGSNGLTVSRAISRVAPM